MLKFLVKGQKIEILEREVIASDQIAFVTLKFVFDGDWKKFHKVVQFTQCDETGSRLAVPLSRQSAEWRTGGAAHKSSLLLCRKGET